MNLNSQTSNILGASSPTLRVSIDGAATQAIRGALNSDVGCASVGEQRQQPRMTFGEAIMAIKDGKAVRRQGWNGKGMLIVLERGSFDIREDEPIPAQIDGIPRRLFCRGDRGTITRLPHISMRTASGATVNGWLASQADMLAEDWVMA